MTDGSRRRCTRQRSKASLEHSYGPKEFLAFSIFSVLSSPSQSMLLFSRPGLLCLDLEWVISPFGYVTMSHFERLAIPPHQLLRTLFLCKSESFSCLILHLPASCALSDSSDSASVLSIHSSASPSDPTTLARAHPSA